MLELCELAFMLLFCALIGSIAVEYVEVLGRALEALH